MSKGGVRSRHPEQNRPDEKKVNQVHKWLGSAQLGDHGQTIILSIKTIHGYRTTCDLSVPSSSQQH